VPLLGGGVPAGGFGEVGLVEPGLLEPGLFDPGLLEPGLEPGFEVPGLEPGFEVPGFVEPGFEGEPGVFGFPLGLVLGLSGFAFGLFGFVVEGCVPGAFGLVGFDPGAVEGAVEPVGGGVVLPVGGLPVFPVGGADGDVCPGAAEPEGALPPAGACCATTQVAQNRSTDNNVSLLPDIMSPPAWNFPRIPIGGRRTRWYTEVIGGVCANNRATNIRHMP